MKRKSNMNVENISVVVVLPKREINRYLYIYNTHTILNIYIYKHMYFFKIRANLYLPYVIL